jgi:hypothetical protein
MSRRTPTGVLVSGASIAGPVLAYWLVRARPVVINLANEL